MISFDHLVRASEDSESEQRRHNGRTCAMHAVSPALASAPQDGQAPEGAISDASPMPGKRL